MQGCIVKGVILTASEFSRIGKLLGGPQWRAFLADKLGRSERTIRRYADDITNIPADVRHRLAELCQEQAGELMKASRELVSGFADMD